MHNYDENIDPPIPVIKVDLGEPNPEAGHTNKATLYLDTGADITAVPKEVLDTFLVGRMLNYDYVNVSGFERSAGKIIKAYYVNIIINNCAPILTRIIPIHDNVGLLGRDVINHFITELNGPKMSWTVEQSA